MARPRTFSDDVLLAAAQTALLRHGPQEFTLNHAADIAGISRPALIQRFGSRDGLMLALAEYELRRLSAWLEALPSGQGRAETWAYLVQLTHYMGSGETFPARTEFLSASFGVPGISELNSARYQLLEEGVQKRLPAGEPATMGAFLFTLVLGSIFKWLACPEGHLSHFVLYRLQAQIRLVWPDTDLPLPEEI